MTNENEYRTQGYKSYPVIMLIVFAIAALAFCIRMITGNYSEYYLTRALIIFPVAALITAYYSNNYIKIRYILADNSLIVKTVSKNYEIPYSMFWVVEETKRSFPATRTMKTAPGKYQIKIIYNGDQEIFISPERIDEFLMKLESKLPDPRIYLKKDGKQ